MDRAFVLDGEQIDSVDVDNSNLFAMIGVGKLTKAILGSGPLLNDLTCVPTGPASLNVILNPGEIYTLEAIDGTTYGPIPADAREIVKQGILMDDVTIPLTAPATPGQSIDYLLQVIYQDADEDPENRPFFSASPAVVDTTRRGNLVSNIKAGVPAATGTQVTPTPDAGYTGAWVITVANGQTQINSGDIVEYDAALFITEKLQTKISQAFADARYALSSSFNNSIGANGYQKFPGGLIFQWGTAIYPATGTQLSNVAVTFPITFPTDCFIVNTSTDYANISGALTEVHPDSKTNSGFNAQAYAVPTGSTITTSGTVFWIAIGN